MERNIDLVVPMVFPEDKEWQHDFARYHGGDACCNVRFRSWGTEELLIRCVEKYMPWLHAVYILLSRESQVKPWMERYSKLKVVFHREFIPEKHLPCFSSPCIEMFLARIPGLSEYFIYANDDMFPLSPLSPDDFFLHGKPCVHFRDKSFPESPNVFHRKCLNQQNVIGAPFGKHYVHTWLYTGHSYAPMLKSACEAVWQKYGKEIEKRINPLSRNEHSFNQYVYLLYQHYAKLDIDHAPRTQYADNGRATWDIPSLINDPMAGVVCLNDNENIKDWKQRARLVRETITAKLCGCIATQRVVCIVHYNTPKLTQCCIRSLLKHTKVDKVVVFDNSDKLPFMMKNKQFVAEHKELISVIDNTRGQFINFDGWLDGFSDKEPSPGNNYGSAKHCVSIQWLIDHTDTPFVLMDSDVLIRRDIADFWSHPDCAWVGEVGENVKVRFGYNIRKVQPFLCWLNVPLLRDHNIRYFNPSYMWNLTTVAPNHRYDTGAWFYRAVKDARLPTCSLPLNEAIFHLVHASWRNRQPMEWLNEHREEWE